MSPPSPTTKLFLLTDRRAQQLCLHPRGDPHSVEAHDRHRELIEKVGPRGRNAVESDLPTPSWGQNMVKNTSTHTRNGLPLCTSERWRHVETSFFHLQATHPTGWAPGGLRVVRNPPRSRTGQWLGSTLRSCRSWSRRIASRSEPRTANRDGGRSRSTESMVLGRGSDGGSANPVIGKHQMVQKAKLRGQK